MTTPTQDARGDQCDKCGKLINATELKVMQHNIPNSSVINIILLWLAVRISGYEVSSIFTEKLYCQSAGVSTAMLMFVS